MTLNAISRQYTHRIRKFVELEMDTLSMLVNNAGVNANTMDIPLNYISLDSRRRANA